MSVDIDTVRKATYDFVAGLKASDRLGEYTKKTVRREMESALSLDVGELDAPEYVAVVKEVVDEVMSAPDEPPIKPAKKAKGPASTAKAKSKPAADSAAEKTGKTPKPAPKKRPRVKSTARSASVVPTSDEEDEGAATAPAAKPNPKEESADRTNGEKQGGPASAIGKGGSSEKRANSPASGSVPGPSRLPTESSPSRDGNKEAGGVPDEEKSDSELSVLIDEPPKRKRAPKGEKKKSEKNGKDSGGRKRKASTKEPLSKDEETIKRLKSFVTACGVRKVWIKEFKDLDKPSEQIRHLKQMLSDLGMTGRLSLEQAKAIREKREFQQELEDVKEFATKMTSSSSKRKHQALEKEPESGGESDEAKAAPKRRITARQSIMAFLGDDSE